MSFEILHSGHWPPRRPLGRGASTESPLGLDTGISLVVKGANERQRRRAALHKRTHATRAVAGRRRPRHRGL